MERRPGQNLSLLQQQGKRLGRQQLAEQIPLQHVATALLEKSQLLLRLDPFGDFSAKMNLTKLTGGDIDLVAGPLWQLTDFFSDLLP